MSVSSAALHWQSLAFNYPIAGDSAECSLGLVEKATSAVNDLNSATVNARFPTISFEGANLPVVHLQEFDRVDDLGARPYLFPVNICWDQDLVNCRTFFRPQRKVRCSIERSLGRVPQPTGQTVVSTAPNRNGVLRCLSQAFDWDQERENREKRDS